MINIVLDSIRNEKDIYIFGCGIVGKDVCQTIKSIFPTYKNIFFTDNNKNLWGSVIQDCIVIKPEELIHNNNCIVIIASLNYYEQIMSQLICGGISSDKVIYCDSVKDKIIENLSIKLEKRRPCHSLKYLTLDMAEHCNLNCQSCDHFSPLVSSKYPDYEEFCNDINRLAYLFKKSDVEIEEICLEGGEPLLNDDLMKFMQVTRQVFPKSAIYIYTNGILLEKQKNEFWNLCNLLSIGLKITKYPINFNYDEMKKKASEKGVKYIYFSGDKDTKMSMFKPLNLVGDSNKYESFEKCYMGNGMCTVLKHGHIYPCTVAANVESFNTFFHQNIEICETDGINIYKANSAQQILEFLCNPINMCRYCQPDKWTYNNKWKTTKYSINEWADKIEEYYEKKRCNDTYE